MSRNEKLYSAEVKSMTVAAKVVNCDTWLFELHDRILKLEKKALEDKLTIAELNTKLRDLQNSITIPLFSKCHLPTNDAKKVEYNEAEVNLINAVTIESD